MEKANVLSDLGVEEATSKLAFSYVARDEFVAELEKLEKTPAARDVMAALKASEKLVMGVPYLQITTNNSSYSSKLVLTPNGFRVLRGGRSLKRLDARLLPPVDHVKTEILTVKLALKNAYHAKFTGTTPLIDRLWFAFVNLACCGVCVTA